MIGRRLMGARVTRRGRGGHRVGWRWICLAGSVLAVGCADAATGPEAAPQAEVGIVLNSVDNSLTVFQLSDPSVRKSVGLGPDGSPVTFAVRGRHAAVAMGMVPAVAVVDLVERAVVRTIGLPEGSGATGIAFLNDSIAVVANPGLNSVTPVNVLRGTSAAAVAVGGFPHRVVAAEGALYVVNAELGSDFLPARTGTLTVLTGGADLSVQATIELSGLNPSAAVAGTGGVLYVVNAGRWGENEGSVSVVDRTLLSEVDHASGFGDFPGTASLVSGGRLLVGSFSYGIVVWDVETGEFVHGPDSAIAPGGIPSAAGLGVDGAGRAYALEPNCQAPARVFRLDGSFAVAAEIPVGTCPIEIGFTALPEFD